MKLSKERLEEIRDFDTCVKLEESAEMARHLLSGLEQEPVGEVVLGDYDDCGDYPDAKVVCIAAQGQADWNNFSNGTKLYAAPQLPQPELTVFYKSMPESNGKENWTAILHRKGEGIQDGITIDRSEYPGRVLYAADRVRYLIGEKPDRPYILDYDGDKHSGYVYPVAPAPVVPEEFLSAMEEVLRISDRDHDAWHKAKAGIVSCRATMLQGAEPVQGWIPCSERMPEDSKWCVVNTAYGYYLQCWTEGKGWLGVDESIPSRDVTHWMPLPAAPQQEVKP